MLRLIGIDVETNEYSHGKKENGGCMSLYINPNDPDLKEKIERISPTPGFCIFIDIVGSTKLKDQGLKRWIAFIYNVFANITTYLYMKFTPIKIMGDCFMFYIPESDMKDETALTIFDGLYKIISSNEPYLRDVKIGAAFCRDAYNISFIEGNLDFYGKDIDLASRLLSLARPKEIVFNDEFYNRVRRRHNSIINKDNFPYMDNITNFSSPIRGFSEQISAYRLLA
jgi:hypothetical protein